MRSSETCLDNLRRHADWTGIFAQGVASLGRVYCRYFHATVSRPVKGKYRCWRCLREFELEWKV
jgi:hypothetical protein